MKLFEAQKQKVKDQSKIHEVATTVAWILFGT